MIKNHKNYLISIFLVSLFFFFTTSAYAIKIGTKVIPEGAYEGEIRLRTGNEIQVAPVKIAVSDSLILGFTTAKDKIGDITYPLIFSKSKQVKTRFDQITSRFSFQGDSTLKFVLLVRGKPIGKGSARLVENNNNEVSSEISGAYILDDEVRVPIVNIASDGSATIIIISFEILGLNGSFDEDGNFVDSLGTMITLTKINNDSYELKLIASDGDIGTVPLIKIEE